MKYRPRASQHLPQPSTLHTTSPLLHKYVYSSFIFSSDGRAPWPLATQTAQNSSSGLSYPLCRLSVWQHEGTSFGCRGVVPGNRWPWAQGLLGDKMITRAPGRPCHRSRSRSRTDHTISYKYYYDHALLAFEVMEQTRHYMLDECNDTWCVSYRINSTNE